MCTYTSCINRWDLFVQGFNLQLTAVLLTLGVYAYIESGMLIINIYCLSVSTVLSYTVPLMSVYVPLYPCTHMIFTVMRKKLGRRLNACVLDRPCSEACGHQFGSDVWWVLLVNVGFTLLNMFHLAYLGVMFGGAIEEESADLELEVQGIHVSMFVFQVMATNLCIVTYILALFSILHAVCEVTKTIVPDTVRHVLFIVYLAQIS